MGFLDKFKKEPKKEKPKKSGMHGSHWDTLVESDTELQSIVMGTVEKSESKESMKWSGDQKITAFFSSGEHLKTCTITVNNQIWTAYPFIHDGIIHEVTIEDIDMWLNELEGQIQCGLGGTSFAFFDTMYFKNKDKYKNGEKYNFSLSAMAYSLAKAEPKTIKDKEGRELSTKGMAAFFPFQNGDIDDFIFQVPVKEVMELKFENKDIYRIKAPLFRSNGSWDIDIYIYASKSTTKGYVPQAGDDISGIMWLQGYIK